MGLINLDKVVTEDMAKIKESQQKTLASEFAKVLESPGLKKLIAEYVEIGEYIDPRGSSFFYGNLYLSREGLVETSGYKDASVGDGTYPNDSQKYPLKKIGSKDLIEIEKTIERYSISQEDIQKLQSRFMK